MFSEHPTVIHKSIYKKEPHLRYIQFTERSRICGIYNFMSDYRLENDVFVIENYDLKIPFTSFLPGLVGENGIPLWSFYVNRGQCMTSFGIEKKENPIMEFQPAVIAYENTALKGFRTFIRKNGTYFEPFSSGSSPDVKRSMYIKSNSFCIREVNNLHQIQTDVTYFILPQEPFGGLVRNVVFTNLGSAADFEILDGMSRIIPYGIPGSKFTMMANLMRSYNTISNLEHHVPLFFSQIESDDAAEMKENVGGYYYLSFDSNGILCPVYDPCALFEHETSLQFPVNFMTHGLSFVTKYPQHFTNKISCAFAPSVRHLDAGESYTVSTLCGFAHSDDFINRFVPRITEAGYIDRKLAEADALSVRYTNDIASETANPVLDAYFRQSYLDNFLRGGYPMVIPGKKKDKVIHLFSRKHGDPERDYNQFSTAAEYYSQGDGNFRDVLQNRRCDIIFHPEICEFDIEHFYSLVQIDGYTPMYVKASTFSIPPEHKADIASLIDSQVITEKDKILSALEGKFTAGSLANVILGNNLSLSVPLDDFVRNILSYSQQNHESSTEKVGNYIDQWDYLLDMILCYQRIYPEKMEALVFGPKVYTYFDSDQTVKPRSEKYFFNGKEARQLDAFFVNTKKYERGYLKDGTNWLKTADGEIYHANLIEKLITIIVNKIALLDPCQMGIEMEANRAGWCDACNGLPSLFGSGMSENFEVSRTCEFVKNILTAHNGHTVTIPEELYELYTSVDKSIAECSPGFELWDSMADARERYRAKTCYCISGKTVVLNIPTFLNSLDTYIRLLSDGVEKAMQLGDGLCPTYFKYIASDYEIIKENPEGYPNIRVKAFEPKKIVDFLEGSAKQIRNCTDPIKASTILDRVKASELYDKKLKMYKTSGSTKEEGLEFGRIAIFTPGWQENESIFLHMEYKFLFSLIESGLFERFYEEMRNLFVPFCNPEVYGRSILENCSFIASSANPDETLHGRGFVSRLSGSNSEVLYIWADMFLGEQPFVYKNGQLGLSLCPKLSADLFDAQNCVKYNFLTTNTVKLHNPSRRNTWDASIDYVIVDGRKYEGSVVWGADALKVRDIRNSVIDIYYR